MSRTPRSLVAFVAVFAVASSVFLSGETASGQELCFPQAYSLRPTTVYEQQTVERLRPTYRTRMVEQEVTSYRPVVKSRTEMREIRVPVTTMETSYQEEQFSVWKPVTETSYRDETYNETRLVTETQMRDEQYTTFRPVTETKVYQRQYSVQRPVTETRMYQQQYSVQRPVTETQLQTQQYLSYRPQTQVYNQTVDAGGYVPETTITPGQVGLGVQYQRGLYATPGPLGIFARVRGGNVVAPYYTPPVARTQMVYRPNYVNQQIAQTSYQPVMEQRQVPVQVQRMQTEVVTQNVPVQSTRLETQVMTENVPVQTTRMVPTTMVRKVPFVVQRPVTETKTRRVPITSQRWIKEERVRRVPVQTSKVVYETRRVPHTVQYTEYEPVVTTVKRPVTEQVYQPYEEVITVPRQVMQRVPVDYFDPFSTAITSGYSSFVPASSNLPAPVIVQPNADKIELQRPELYDGEPATDMRPLGDSPSDASGELQLNTPEQAEEIETPKGDVLEAGYRIRWTPRLSRSI
ncbi:MAG: hypothetical protein AAFV88_02055 [Planctomycetota bacterium]